MSLELTIRNPDGRSQTLTFQKEMAFIGRREGNDVQLPFSFVSGRHCRFCRQGAHLLVEDLGSTNGIVVNGEVLPSKTIHALKSDDVVHIGTVEIRARWIEEAIPDATILEATPAPPPPPAPQPKAPLQSPPPSAATPRLQPAAPEPDMSDAPATMWEIQTGVYRSSSMQIDDHRVGTPIGNVPVAPRPAFDGHAMTPPSALAQTLDFPSGTDAYRIWAFVFQAVGIVTLFGAIVLLIIILLS